jgi:hypothetical protein
MYNEQYDNIKYMKLLGSLMYLTKSRPDILPACSFAATHSKAPTKSNYIELLYIVEYLRETKDMGLIINTRDKNNNNFIYKLYCEVDASYLIHPDSRGQTGYCIGFAKVGFFYFRSSKQSLVSTSSTHAEMRALYTLVKDIIYIVELTKEINIPLELPCIVMEDNSAVLTIAKEQCSMMKRCKHFLMIINYIQEKISQKYLLPDKISSAENVSDIMTKKKRGGQFAGYKRDKIMGIIKLNNDNNNQNNINNDNKIDNINNKDNNEIDGDK